MFFSLLNKIWFHILISAFIANLSMLLFSKISSIAQVLRLLKISLEKERELNVHKSYKRSL